MCLEQKIRQTAHEIWLQQGCPHGRQKEHWSEAEQKVVQAEVGRLKNLFQQKQQKLDCAVKQIDGRVLRCQRVLSEYAAIRARLSRLGAKLETLGFMPLPLPYSPPVSELAEFLQQRIVSSIPRADDP